MRWFYRCPSCGATYEIEPGRYLCDRCAAGQQPMRPLAGVLEADWEGEWGPADGEIPFPVGREWFPAVPVGDTPLWRPARLRQDLGFPNLFLKDDTANPTGSLKDRASLLVAAFALEFGIREIALASTGNAASSMAGIGAASGLSVTVFLPASAPPAKRVQVLQYGAVLRQVEGSYDLAYDRSLAYTAGGTILSRNTAFNPLTIEGKKSAAFEIARQLGEEQGFGSPGRAAGREPVARSTRGAGRGRAVGRRSRAGVGPACPWEAPDHLFVPTGDGVILGGLYRGFENLLRLGRIDRMPTLWACQAEGSSAIARALESGGFGEPTPSRTLADSISVDVPRNGLHALAKLSAYGGRAVTVTDEAILAAQRLLASRAGLFAEPSSSAALAGFLKVRGEIPREAKVVLLITGSGLKDIASAARGVGAMEAGGAVIAPGAEGAARTGGWSAPDSGVAATSTSPGPRAGGEDSSERPWPAQGTA